MRRPHFSIAGLMAFTALVALHCLAARSVLAFEHDSLYFVVGLLMADILTVGLVSLGRGGRAGQPSRFLAGVEAVGWPALILSTACFVLARPLVEAYQERMFSIASAVTGVRKLDGMPSHWRAFANIVAILLTYSAILISPPLIPALVAGWLASHLR